MAVQLDGTSDYWQSETALASASKTFTLAVWFKTGSAVTGATRVLLSIVPAASAVPGLSVAINSSAGLSIVGRDSLAAQNLGLASTGLTLAASTWYFLLAAVDLGNVAAQLRVNDTDYADTPTIVDSAIDLDDPWWVGASNDGADAATSFFNGAFDYVFFSTAYKSLAVEANRRKFYGARREQIGLGPGALRGVGVAPELYLFGGPSTFGKNGGSAGSLSRFGQASHTPGRPAGVETLSRGFRGELWKESDRSGIPFPESELVLESASGLVVARREVSTDRDEINRERRRNATVFERD